MNNDEIEAAVAALEALVESDNDPNREQVRSLLSGNLEGPFHFVNLLRFKESAEYPSDHELSSQGLDGAQAYDLYGAVALEQVTKRGGRLVTLNNVEKQLIGASTGWHRVATMEYQNIKAFVDMLLDPDYQAALVHREAGLEATEVIVTPPLLTAPIG